MSIVSIIKESAVHVEVHTKAGANKAPVDQ